MLTKKAYMLLIFAVVLSVTAAEASDLRIRRNTATSSLLTPPTQAKSPYETMPFKQLAARAVELDTEIKRKAQAWDETPDCCGLNQAQARFLFRYITPPVALTPTMLALIDRMGEFGLWDQFMHKIGCTTEVCFIIPVFVAALFWNGARLEEDSKEKTLADDKNELDNIHRIIQNHPEFKKRIHIAPAKK